MNNKKKWLILTIILAVLSLIFFIKFIELKNITPDGDGIGISLLGIELLDSVPNSSATFYANGFLVFSILILMNSAFSFLKWKKVK